MAKASIIIPVYNKEKYLLETLISVDKQSHDDLEIIIVDDASTDKSMDIIYDFASNTRKNVKIIKNDINRGVAYCRNLGIEISKSDYISFLDADDLIDKYFVEIMLSKFERYPFLDFIQGLHIPFDINGDLCDGTIEGYYEEKIIIPALETDYVAKSGVSCTDKLYKKGFVENLKFVESAFEDYEFFLDTVAANGKLLYTKEAKYKYRIIKDGKYRTHLDKINSCFEHFDIYDRFDEKHYNIVSNLYNAIKDRHVYICVQHLNRLLFNNDLEVNDQKEFIYNYLQYLKIRYGVVDEKISKNISSDVCLITDPQVLRQNLKKIAMKY